MNPNDRAHRDDHAPPGFWGSRYSIGLLVFAVAALYFLLTEHRAHFLGALPYLILLACPLMHVFMHHGHGNHDHHGSSAGLGKPDQSKPGESS